MKTAFYHDFAVPTMESEFDSLFFALLDADAFNPCEAGGWEATAMLSPRSYLRATRQQNAVPNPLRLVFGDYVIRLITKGDTDRLNQHEPN